MRARWGWKQARAHLRFFAGAAAKARQLGYKLEHFWLGEPLGCAKTAIGVGELAGEILLGQLQHHPFGIPSFPTITLVEGTWFDGASLPSRRISPPSAPTAARNAGVRGAGG
jgi:hypothetical protein